MLGLVAPGLHAQSYESAFEPLTVGKASRKHFKNDFVSVEPGTGFVGLTVPLGPGIGARGLNYTPTVRMHMSPKNNPRHVYNWAPGATSTPSPVVMLSDQWVGDTMRLSPSFWRPSSFAFGDPHGGGTIVMYPEVIDLNSQVDWYNFNADESSLRSIDPGYLNLQGGLETLGAVLPSGESVAAQLPLSINNPGSPENVARASQYADLLKDFGYAATDVSDWGAIPGSQGYLIFTLKDASGKNATYTDRMGPGATEVQYQAPARILIVKGPLATEFTFAGTRQAPWSGEPMDVSTLPQRTDLRSRVTTVGYAVSAQRNRFNDAIVFTHDPDGIGFTAELKINGATSGQKVSLAYVSNDGRFKPSSFPVGGPGIMSTNLGNIQMKVTYGGSSVGDFTLTARDATGGIWGEDCIISGGENPWGYLSHHLWEKRRLLEFTQIRQASTEFQVDVAYKQLDYAGPYPRLSGVYDIKANAFDTISFPNGEKFGFEYTPFFFFSDFFKSDSNNPVIGGHAFPPLAWGVTTMTQTDTVLHTSRVTQYERKFPAYHAGMSPAHWDDLAYWEAETHPDGQVTVRKFVPPPQDSNARPTDSLATRMQAYLFSKNALYETATYGPDQDWRTELTGNATSAELVNYSTRWVLNQVGNPTGAVYLGGTPIPTQQVNWNRETQVAQQHQTGNWDAASQSWSDSVASTFTTDNPYSTFSLAKTALGTVSAAVDPLPSTFGGYVLDRRTATTYLPLDSHYFPGLWSQQEDFEKGTRRLPLQTQKVSTSTGIADWRQVGDGTLWTKVEYTYGGPAGLPSSLVLKGSSGLLLGAGEVGIQEYGYDANLRMNKITPKGGFPVSQENEALWGTPTSQTDANDFQTKYTWDDLGRLTGIIPPSPETSTTLSYPTFRSMKVTHGTTTTKEEYNAFGELVSTTKPSGESKTYVYDDGGRKTFESVWGNPAIVGTFFEYKDPLFRLTRVVDPNLVENNYQYSKLKKTAYLGATTGSTKTVFESDALGRLVNVTDALNQVTTYGYDAADRVTSVSQDSGKQTRGWTYNALGWLESLTQPESGTTAYSKFTVFGKPTQTNYAGRIVTTTYDALGRVKFVGSDDQTVAQSFVYDSVAHGKGKVGQAVDKGVVLDYGYEGLNGRLSTLSTTLSATSDGAIPSFPQTFAYNNLGQRETATLPSGRTVKYVYDSVRETLQETQAELGVPRAFSPMASLAKVTEWNLADSPSTVTFGNGASTVFAYDNDQARLHSMTHQKAGGLGNYKQWTYDWDPVTGWLKGDGEDHYTYDDLGRLYTATVAVPGRGFSIQQSFNYDPFGNQILSKTVGLPSDLTRNFADFQFYAADLRATNRLPAFTSAGAATGAVYDDQGNLKQIFKQAGAAGRAMTLTYDALGRVTEMTDGETGVTERYAYTTEGLRTKVEEYRGGALTKIRYNVYNDARQLVSQYEWTPSSQPSVAAR